MLKAKLAQLCESILQAAQLPDNLALFDARDEYLELFAVLSAMANFPGGGILLFGVSDAADGAPAQLCGVSDAARLTQIIDWQCAEMSPPIQPLYTQTTVDGKRVLAAQIPEIDKARKPCYHLAVGRPHGAFKRVGRMNRPMSEAEIHSYDAYNSRTRDELRPCEQARWADINPDGVETYMRRLESANRLRAGIDREQLLQMEGLMVDGKPTLASILLFSYDPQSFYPQYSIMAAVYEDGKARECRRLNGTLDTLCEQALQFIRRQLPAAVRYPMDAVREALLNALIHRDYSKYAEDLSVYLWISESHIEICSPGMCYGAPDMNTLPRGLRSLRNPKLMEILETLGALPQEHSGMQYMEDTMAAAGLPQPEIRLADDWCHVFFHLPPSDAWPETAVQDEAMSELEWQVCEYCAEPRTLAELAAHFGWKSPYYMRTKLLTEMIDKEYLAIGNLDSQQKKQYQALLRV